MQANYAKNFDVIIPWKNLLQYKENCSKTSGSLRKYSGNEPDDNDIEDSEWFKFKPTFTENSNNKYRSNVRNNIISEKSNNIWRIFEIPLIHSEINLIVNWSTYCITANAIGPIGDTKLYAQLVTLSFQNNAKN